MDEDFNVISSKEKHPILVILKANPDRAFTVKNLSYLTKKAESTVRKYLTGSLKKNLILCKSPYYIIKRVEKKRNK